MVVLIVQVIDNHTVALILIFCVLNTHEQLNLIISAVKIYTVKSQFKDWPQLVSSTIETTDCNNIHYIVA